jgi:hypothetical protein
VKGTFKALLAGTAIATLAGCSSFTTIAERDEYAQPKWYADCAESGSEGWFWWKEDFAYACGAGESRFQQAAEEQMYAIAMNNFAKRINGRVNSETVLNFKNDSKSTNTMISYTVDNTAIREHIAEERGTYIYAGKHYTFVKLKMNKQVFDRLINEAKDVQVTSR